MARLARRDLAAILLAAAAARPALAAPTAAEAPTRITVITHGQATDPYWSVVKNGVDAGAKGRVPRSTTTRPTPSTWCRWRS